MENYNRYALRGHETGWKRGLLLTCASCIPVIRRRPIRADGLALSGRIGREEIFPWEELVVLRRRAAA